MSPSLLAIVGLLVVLAVVALRRGDGTFGAGMRLMAEQLIVILPRITVALVAASFVAELIPSETVSTFLGKEAGITAVIIAALIGMCIPAGAVIIFAITAVLARAGADVPALVAFIVGWSVFSVQRMIIFEMPIVGLSYLRVKVISVLAVPFLAGLLALGLTQLGIQPGVPSP